MAKLGFNIAATVQKASGTREFSYIRFLSREENEIGYVVNTYADPIVLSGTIQPVEREVYQQRGLDFNREYINIFATEDISDLARNRSTDKIIYNNETYSVVGEDEWTEWNEILCVRQNNA